MSDDGDEPGFISATPEEAATVPEVKYEYLDHPADIQIHAWGDNLREAYEQAAMGMYGYMTDPETVEIEEVREVEAEAEDLQGLLFHFLDECLFTFCCEPYFIPRKVVITEWVAGGGSGASGKEAEGKGEGGGKEGSACDGGKGKVGKGEEEGKEGSSSDDKGEKSKEEREGKGGGTGNAEGKEKGKESGGKGDSSKSKKREMEVEESGGSDGKKGRGDNEGEEAKQEDMEVGEQGSSDDKQATDIEREEGGFGGTGGEATSGHDGSGAGTLRIRARLYGEEFDLDKHPQGTEVKAITYASMQVYDKPGHHEVFFIVDI